MDLPDYIKIPGAVLIAHGEIEEVRVYKKDEPFSVKEMVFERGWLIFVKEPPVTKGETG